MRWVRRPEGILVIVVADCGDVRVNAVADLRCRCHRGGGWVLEDEVCAVGVLLHDWLGDVVSSWAAGGGEVAGVAAGGARGILRWRVAVVVR
jgi:hypothetical protein